MCSSCDDEIMSNVNISGEENLIITFRSLHLDELATDALVRWTPLNYKHKHYNIPHISNKRNIGLVNNT